MAKTKDENGDGGKTENVAPDTNLLIAQALAALAANQPKRVITEDSPEYQDRLRAEGIFDAFPKPVYQNGRECEPRGLSEETRTRAASLKPGTYTVGRTTVTVDVTSDGGRHIKYRSKSVEERMSYASSWSDFSDLIDKLWAQMALVAA